MTTAVALAANSGTNTANNNMISVSQASAVTTPSSPPSVGTASINTNGSTSTSTTNNNNGNRLLFNRLANERKTVHVFNSNIKDLAKRDRQLLSSYNHATGATTNTGTLTNGTNGGGASNTGTLTSNNAATNLHNNYTGMGNPSTLDYNMTTGRSHTNTSSFLQKLSSKFTRR